LTVIPQKTRIALQVRMRFAAKSADVPIDVVTAALRALAAPEVDVA